MMDDLFDDLEDDKSLRKKLRIWQLKPGSKNYAMFQEHVKSVPTILIQRHDGWIAINLSGKDIPEKKMALLSKIHLSWPKDAKSPWDSNPYKPDDNPFVNPYKPSPLEPYVKPEKVPKKVPEEVATEEVDKKWYILAALAIAGIFLYTKR
jgi:hypothetical protein